MSTDYQGNQVRVGTALAQWHAGAESEPVREPELAIIDAHHHLYDDPARGNRYLMPDLLADVGSGHRVLATVYVEAYASMWRARGPQEMRPVGEIEFAAGVGAIADSGTYGPCRVAAAIVGHADLTQGDAVGAVLDEQLAAGRGRLRGIRYQLAHEAGVVGQYIMHKSPPGTMADPQFRRGLAQLAPRGLHFEAWLLHHQLHDLATLAQAFPETLFVLNHVGGRIGVAQYREQAADVLAQWRAGMATLAAAENVVLKIGGLGMPVFGFGFEQGTRPANSDELLAAWQPLILECVARFGAERCMLESNFPVDRQSCSYLALWNTFKRATAQLSAAERQALFNGTARRLYRID